MSEILHDPEPMRRWIQQGFMPPEFNLTFLDDDVISIIAEDEETKRALVATIQSGQLLVSRAATEKVFTVDEYVKAVGIPGA